ncbi:hypothetical protein Tco_1023691 [Tanacetum coccineum]
MDHELAGLADRPGITFDRPSLDHYLAGLADRPRTRCSIPQIKFVCGNKHRSEEEGLTSHEAKIFARQEFEQILEAEGVKGIPSPISE